MENHNSRAPLYLLAAIAVAVGIWFYVDTNGNNGGAFPARQKITDIPIEYTGEAELEERGLMLVDEGTTAAVDLAFDGARLLVVQLDRAHIRLTADLSGITSAGVQTVRYTPSYLDDKGLVSLSATQKYARVTIDRLTADAATVNISELNRKEVDVRCEVVGTVAEGFSAGQIRLSQNTVEIQGLEDKLDAVSYAKVTLDLGEGAAETVSELLTCQFCDENGELLDLDGLHPKVEQIQATLPVYLTKDLELRVDLVESAGAREKNVTYSIQPPKITVSGEASVLRDVDSINLGYLDLLELVGGGNITRHTFSINVPEGCENLSGVSRATIQIGFRDMVIAQIPTDRFAVDGELPEGKSAEVLTGSLDVTVFGTAEDVRAVRGEDLLLTADLSDYAAASGVYTVAAEASLRTSRDVGIDGEYQIQVRIREEEEETAGEESGETAGEESGEAAGEAAGETSGEPAGETSEEAAGEAAGEAEDAASAPQSASPLPEDAA